MFSSHSMRKNSNNARKLNHLRHFNKGFQQVYKAKRFGAICVIERTALERGGLVIHFRLFREKN